MNRFAVIVAGGTGQRFGSPVPKQFLLLSGKPVLMHSIEKFSSLCKDVVVVLPLEYFSHWKKICSQFNFEIPHLIVSGGPSRSISVMNGLDKIGEDGLVAVHDAARPLVSKLLIEKVFLNAEKSGNAVPCIRVNDSIRILNADENKAMNRDDFRLVQTPQCFSLGELKKAFSKFSGEEFTDEASMMERFGLKINLIDGELFNIKITGKSDLAHAEILFSQKHV